MIKLTLIITVTIFCTISIAATIMMMASVPSTTTGKLFAVGIAVAMELAKFSFFPVSIKLFTQAQKQRILGSLLFALGAVLFVISIAATVGFLENANQTNNTLVQQNSIEHQTRLHKLDAIKQRINTLNQLTQTDADNNFRKRSYDNQKQLNQLETQRDQVIRQMQNQTPIPTGEMASMISSTANALNINPKKLKTFIWWTLAILIDLNAIIILAYLQINNNQPKKTDSTTSNTSALENIALIKKPESIGGSNAAYSKKINAWLKTQATEQIEPGNIFKNALGITTPNHADKTRLGNTMKKIGWIKTRIKDQRVFVKNQTRSDIK